MASLNCVARSTTGGRSKANRNTPQKEQHMSISPQPSSEPYLRLYQPPGSTLGSGEPPPKPKRKNPSLEAVFRRYVLPDLQLRKRSPRTIADIELSLREWRAFWEAKVVRIEAERGTRIPHPWLIRSVRQHHLERWQAHLAGQTSSRTGAPLSTATINRKLGAIRQVLVAAEGKIIARRPRVRCLSTKPAPKYYVTESQISALWLACDSASWPRVGTLSAAEWWRCALLLYWVYGFRTQELVAFARGMDPLKWSAITFGRETPNPEGTAENPHGWLSYTPQKQKWAKPAPLYLPLTAHTRAALDKIRSAMGSAPDQAIFPWPRGQRDFYQAWKRLQKSASVRTKSGEPFELKALRKSAATYLEKHHKGLGAAVCGWAARGESNVMKTHYEVTELVLVEKLGSYPLPACFDGIHRDAQMRLF